MHNIHKSQVALRFAQAGQSYTEHAVVQKHIAQHLYRLMKEYCPNTFEHVFEIGCGSGNLSYLLLKHLQIQHLVLNDLYFEVQAHFQGNHPLTWSIGDIEELEFPKSLDLITSSSALQWVSDLDAVFQKAYEALNPQSFLCFSTFGAQNFKEIKALTGQGLAYFSCEQLQLKLQQQGFEVIHISEQIQPLFFAHPKQVLQHLKATGVTATASNFRWTKQTLMDFYMDYRQFCAPDIGVQNQQGLATYPLTYHPIFCIARRVL